MSRETISTSGPRLGSVSFTTNCCERQLRHHTAIPWTITVLPVKPARVKRSPVRTSVKLKRTTGEVAAVGAAALVGVADAPEVATAGDGEAVATGAARGPAHATHIRTASDRLRAVRMDRC